MTSFHKTVESQSSINGSKVKNNHYFLSSGIPSLDHIIGGGLSGGSIFAVEEDAMGDYSRVLMKYFIAEGVVCKHDILVASADEDPEDIVRELPRPCVEQPDDEDVASVDIDKMKIAWRYEALNQVESSFGTNTSLGHHFDLSKTIDLETINNVNIKFWNSEEKLNPVNSFKNALYHNLLKTIEESIIKEEYQNNSKNHSNKRILRIAIGSLGSPFWLAPDCDDDGSHTYYTRDLIKFMYCLRIIVRDTNAIVFVTIPSHLFNDDILMRRLLYSIDNAVKIESFTGSSREANPLYKDYHGLFHITKLSANYSLVPFVPPSLDLAFKLRRKKFVIEKLHLPPELEESSEREQDDVTATPVNCGSFKKKNIDF